MIRLVALDQTNRAQTTLELEGAPSISLNLAVAKPGETMQRHAPYSQTFRLPFTNTNNQFFAHFYEVTLSDGDGTKGWHVMRGAPPKPLGCYVLDLELRTKKVRARAMPL